MIPYVDLAKHIAPMEEEMLAAARRVLRSGRFILGPEVEAFEEDFADFHGASWAVSVGSGADALALALQAVGVGPGDEVVTVPNSFVATVAAIVRVGARVVFADVDDSFNLDPDRVEAVIGARTRAIMPVHLYGTPADMGRITSLANNRKIAVIEDCAQAVGADVEGRSVGTFGIAGCFSLHPLKNLGAVGDGGVIIGADPSLRDKLRRLRNHGLVDRDHCEFWGLNSRLDPLQAAMLRVKLAGLRGWILRRRSIAARYLDAFADLPLGLPGQRTGTRSVWSAFTVRTPRRDALRRHLAEDRVETLLYYPVPIHLQRAARSLGYPEGSLPTAERHAHEILSIPIRPELEDAEVQHIIDSVRRFFRGSP